MTIKSAKAALGGAHTAGIYADMTLDGPEIGTLVVIVDRAKNLPNRKTMGKQDPYCAARLGKEAKKTETDKRGGQTPRWDQELRFTVHESPDYYTLKVSVFNDDKRTELIGETRIGLEDIVVPGGGQNDKWHNLHCKGRFAGEIRIELTYYDTRPKEEKPPDRQSEPAVHTNQEPGRDNVGGPRGPKPLKRRPLPANPTENMRPAMPEHSHSAPLPQSTHQIIHQPTPSYPDHYGHRVESTPPSANRYDHIPQTANSGFPVAYEGYGQEWIDGQKNNVHNYDHGSVEDHHAPDMAFDIPGQHSHERYHEQYNPRQTHQIPQRPLGLEDPYVDAYQPIHHHGSLPDSASYNRTHPSAEQRVPTSYDYPYSSSPPSIPHGNSMPDVRPNRYARSMDPQPQRHSLPNVRGNPEQSPTQQPYSNGYSQDFAYQQPSYPEDDDVPPPPPAHRTNSGVNSSPLGSGPPASEGRVYPIPGTAPLNIRKERGSFSNSPLSQVQNSATHSEYPLSASPSHVQRYGHSSAMTTSRQNETSSAARDAYHRRSISPTRNGQPMPSSLVPGQVPDSSQQMPSNAVYDSRARYKQTSDREITPQHQQSQYQQVQTPTMSRPNYGATIQTQSPLQAIERGPDRRSHRASAPVTHTHGVSPDPRIPPRKSVSPRPEFDSNERRGSDVPFGPDSYDAFNPFVNSKSAGVSPGARYETPEQAREASIQHDREQRLGDGPIIGSDGRVIDPSDHLPTETWAPEPEAKAPRKTAQVNLRFRNSPQGAQPMPRPSPRVLHDTSTRPASISTSPYSQDVNGTTDNISPVTAARARLQKKSRVSPAHPNSSPAVPMVNTALQNPVLRSTASDFPLKEHENYGYGSSPTYNRPSPTGIPPPVPGKIPIGMGQEDWRRDPLSEELSRIDIGVGGGRTRRNRYGG